MNQNRRIISNFVSKLQVQRDIPLWSIANEQIIYNTALQQSLSLGTKTNIIYKMLSIAFKFKMSDFFIFFVGFLRAFSIWYQVKKKKSSKFKDPDFKRIFAGFGASSEEYLYAQFVKESTDPSLRINWVTYEGLEKIGLPSLWSILFGLVKNSFGYSNKLKNSISELSSNPVAFLTVCTLNIGTYVFFRSFWHRAKLQGIQSASFLVVDLPAFAAIDENINTIYLQHGLMKFSILMPNIHKIEVLTLIEENYLKSTLKNVEIVRKTNIKNNLSTSRNNVLLIMSLNVLQTARLKLCEPIIQWAKKMEMQIVVRPTIKVDPLMLNDLFKKLHGVECDDYKMTLEESLEKWRPKIVTAWSSTGLATALDYGYLPVSLYKPEDNEIWDDMIYPMKNRVLFWSRDYPIIEKAIQSDLFYVEQIQHLNNYYEKF